MESMFESLIVLRRNGDDYYNRFTQCSKSGRGKKCKGEMENNWVWYN